jgi:16S rRNA processing protein RimM
VTRRAGGPVGGTADEVTPSLGADDRVEIGAVARAHGVRGELRVVLHNPSSTALDEALVLFVGGRELAVESSRPTTGAWLVRVAGVDDRDQADALRGQPVAVARDQLALEDDEVLLVDLVGCRVELPDGTPWGEIVAIEPGPQDRLIVRQGDVERQLPVVDEIIVEVDLEGGRVVASPPEGLPEEPARRR